MKISRFFIDRPVFAWVIAISIMLFGGLSIFRLSVSQYPKIAPPTVSIKANYPGASAEVLENSVTQVIEQKLTGIDGMRYFASTSSSNGFANITITFEADTDPDVAQVQVQNKLQSAMKSLPQDVQAQGVTVTKAGEAEILTVGFYTDDNSMSAEDLGDVVVSKVQDPISRVEGVGDLNVYAAPHAMRIWIDADKLLSYNLTPNDVRAAILAQNIDVSAGQLGGMPAVKDQQLTATITAQSIMSTPEEFRKIILRVNTDGSQVRLADVARIEVGAQSYNHVVRYNRKTATGLQVIMASGANTLEVIAGVKAKLQELKPSLPSNVNYFFPFDASPYISLSIKNVAKTLVEAIVLVFLVMLLFLQNFRATLIPALTVPIVLLGTFGVMSLLGYSINVLTMFAMVLSIGLLVDDAIVVIENVLRVMEEEKLSPYEATRKSMDQITSALLGISLVLTSVFVPMMFFPGSAGIIYRQFSVTLITSIVLSLLVALVLTPTLCAAFLKPLPPGQHESFKGPIGLFNRGFSWYRKLYAHNATYVVKHAGFFCIIYLVFISILISLYFELPKSFLPDEDQGMMLVAVTAPSGATVARTSETAKLLEDHFLSEKEQSTVLNLFTIVGFGGQNAGFAVVRLKDWSEREHHDQSVFALKGRSFPVLMGISDALCFPFIPAAIRELGNSSGFDMQLVDKSGKGHDALMLASDQLKRMVAANPKLQNVRAQGLDDSAEFKIEVDQEKAMAMGVNLSEINQLLQLSWGPTYVNDYIEEGRIKKVYMQGEATQRMNPEDIGKWYVRNKNLEMVPFNSFSKIKWEYGSPKLERYNGRASLNFKGEPAAGISTGEAMAEMEKVVKSIPGNFGVDWTGISYEEKTSGDMAPILYLVSTITIFLSLAALYESWSVPFAILFIIPLGIAGAVISSTLFGFSNNVYFQVGLLTTIGLSAKNAIMIVEFAKSLNEQEGMGIMEATIHAATIRFRPIIMTSVAFILGVLPLALANGAGSASQNAIGVVVLGGMLGATLIDILFVPMFFVLIRKVFKGKTPVERGAQ